jgi:hypothetical protein
MAIADPDYIVTLGSGLPRFFQRFVSGLNADVLHIPFPSRLVTPPATMRAAVDWVVGSLTALKLQKQPPPKTWKWPTSDSKLPQRIMRYP